MAVHTTDNWRVDTKVAFIQSGIVVLSNDLVFGHCMIAMGIPVLDLDKVGLWRRINQVLHSVIR
jgi:hypothetical protein